MADPIHHPFPAEDTIYADVPKTEATSASARAVNARQQIAADIASHRKETQHNDLSGVLSTAAGQAVIMRILDHCRPYQTTISNEPSQFGFQEGRRAVGLWLIDLIQRIDPTLYPTLLLEHLKHQRELANVEAGIALAK